MAAEETVEKKVSGLHLDHKDLPESITGHHQEAIGGLSQSSVKKWLTTAVTEEDAKHQLQSKATEPVRRNQSGDDDLALDVEASLYGKRGVRTIQEFLWWSRSSAALSRWNSFSSATSGHSGPLSVMDVLNLWNDDPEEVLLDLGFGCDEPDLSGRIPARFINHQSQARGINLQVFLEAQQNRLDLENPDVSNRFRQLEVLQQVTTAFSSLVGASSSSSSHRATTGKDLSPEARERRRRVGMLFRRASRKSLSQISNRKTQDPTTPTAAPFPSATPEALEPPPSLGDEKVPLERLAPGDCVPETLGLSQLAEKQAAGPSPQLQPHAVTFSGQGGALRAGHQREGHLRTANTSLQRRKSPGQPSESFEMEEIHSFDDGSFTGSYTGGTENLARGVMRTNSCQSDSSGFQEEPFVLSLPQQASGPGPDLIKALSGLSGGSTDSQSSERPGSACSSSPHNSSSHLHSSSPASSDVDKPLLSSPCPSPEPSSAFGPSHSLQAYFAYLQSSEMDTAPGWAQSSPASSSKSVTEDVPPRSSSPKSQDGTHSQSPTLPSPASLMSLSPTSPPTQAASLIRGSDDIDTEDQVTPCCPVPTLPQEDEGAACFSSIPLSSSPPDLNCPLSAPGNKSSTQSDSSSGSPGNPQSECTEVALHDNSLSVSPLLPSSPELPPPSPPDFLCPSISASPQLIESLSGGPENNHNDSVFSDSDETELSETPNITQKEKDEILPSLAFQLDKDNPSDLSPLFPDSFKLEESCPTLPCPSLNPSISVCHSALPLQSHLGPDVPMHPAAERMSVLTEQSIPRQDDDPASPVQDVIHVKMDRFSLDTEDTLQRNGQGEVESSTDTVQAQDSFVYISDKESSAGLSEGFRLASEEVCNQTKIDPQVPPCSLHDELSEETTQEELREVCRMEITDMESESPRSCLVLHEVPEVHGRTDMEPKDLIEIESLDLVFETSVDGSEGENEDMDDFFQQLDTEGRVYWAEPIQVSDPSQVFKESGSCEASGRSPENSLSPRGSADLDSSSSTGKTLSSSSQSVEDIDQNVSNTTASSDTPSSTAQAQHLKPSSRSVSVQMSSSLSSHIVHRKDVPYVTDSKRNLLPGVLPLDTSTPFRAVQTWTDMQIQRNTLVKKLPHGALLTAPSDVSILMGGSDLTQRPTLTSSSPSVTLLSNDWQAHDCLPGVDGNYQTVSVPVDTGLWPDMEEEEVDRNGNEDEEKLWEGSRMASMPCCCSCDHRCTCCTQRGYDNQHTLGNIPYSLGDLEEMMLCLQQFRSVLSNMEEQLSDDQVAVYSALSDQDREKVRDIELLREAVKQEAEELEMQLNELANHYDDSLKMKMHRLLDEQSLLCSQLRVFLPGAVPASSSPALSRTVATQCCLPPWVTPGDRVSSWGTSNVRSPRRSPPGSEAMCDGLDCSPTMADKLDIVGFLQKLKESLHHSVNADSLE